MLLLETLTLLAISQNGFTFIWSKFKFVSPVIMIDFLAPISWVELPLFCINVTTWYFIVFSHWLGRICNVNLFVFVINVAFFLLLPLVAAESTKIVLLLLHKICHLKNRHYFPPFLLFNQGQQWVKTLLCQRIHFIRFKDSNIHVITTISPQKSSTTDYDWSTEIGRHVWFYLSFFSSTW